MSFDIIITRKHNANERVPVLSIFKDHSKYWSFFNDFLIMFTPVYSDEVHLSLQWRIACVHKSHWKEKQIHVILGNVQVQKIFYQSTLSVSFKVAQLNIYFHKI